MCPSQDACERMQWCIFIKCIVLQEVRERSDKIAKLDQEKASLIRELFEARTKHKSSYDDTTFMWQCWGKMCPLSNCKCLQLTFFHACGLGTAYNLWPMSKVHLLCVKDGTCLNYLNLKFWFIIRCLPIPYLVLNFDVFHADVCVFFKL